MIQVICIFSGLAERARQAWLDRKDQGKKVDTDTSRDFKGSSFNLILIEKLPLCTVALTQSTLSSLSLLCSLFLIAAGLLNDTVIVYFYCISSFYVFAGSPLP